MVKNVTDLEVYQESLKLIGQLYALSREISFSERDIENQLKRASKSIPANLAEGFAKRSSPKEFRRYILIALGSSDEILAHLTVLLIVQLKLKNKIEYLLTEYKILSKRINSLHQKWPTN